MNALASISVGLFIACAAPNFRTGCCMVLIYGIGLICGAYCK